MVLGVDSFFILFRDRSFRKTLQPTTYGFPVFGKPENRFIHWVPSGSLLPFFRGEGSPTKIDYSKKSSTLILT